MNELHIHEVLRMMIDTQKTYQDKQDFVTDIEAKFGKNVKFHACSDSGMDVDDAFEFLMRRGKISLNNAQKVGIDPDMTMCDEDGEHHHHD